MPELARPQSKLLIVGAGIGGLSAAIALGRAHQNVTIIEQSAQLGEVGAGVQLGPNVNHVLKHWGVDKALEALAFEPEAVEVHHALSGKQLARLPLAESFRRRYGAPYLTAHRADLHAALLAAVRAGGYADIRLNQRLQSIQLDSFKALQEEGIKASGTLTVSTESTIDSKTTANIQTSETQVLDQQSCEHYSALVGADGVWSKVRDLIFSGQQSALKAQVNTKAGINSVVFSGDLAYRSLVLQKMLPAHLRLKTVKVWLWPDMHLVQYPVRGGEWLNSVLFLSPRLNGMANKSLSMDVLSALDWTINMSQEDKAANIQSILPSTCSKIQDTVRAIEAWSVWPLMKSNPLTHSSQMVRGSIALLGDAAHPMLPYLAQGAGMAIEDAFELGELFNNANYNSSKQHGLVESIETTLQRYATIRWKRCASVQSRALQNAHIFHASGALAWARDRSLELLGDKILDMPWLYGYQRTQSC